MINSTLATAILLAASTGNNSHSYIIWLVVAGVVFLQLYFSFNTNRSIRQLKGVFPDKEHLFTIKKRISEQDFDNSGTEAILKNRYDSDNDEEEVTLIGSRVECNSIMEDILHSTNTYLLRNRGAVADFNLIRDITDRNINSLEDEIDSTLPVPLYLGLAGTMLGIIIGLIGMPQINSEDFLQGAGIDILIGGVKIAMFSTLAGLILTIFNTSVEFKKSKASTEKRKNDFFTFIQTELLPILTENSASSIHTLDRNLKGFNKQFKSNTVAFAGILNDVGDSLQSQKALYRQIENSDIPGLAKHNLNLFKKFGESAENLEKFGYYLEQISFLTQNSGKLLDRTAKMLDNSDEVAEISRVIRTNVYESNKLMKFIESHFSELEGRKNLIQKSVSDVDSILTQSLENLRQSTESTIEQMRRFTEEEIKKLDDAFQQNTNALSFLKVMPQLEIELKNVIREIKDQNYALRSVLENINENILGMASMPLNVKVEREKEGPYIKAFKNLYYISGALVFTGICLYTGINLLSWLFQWIVEILK